MLRPGYDNQLIMICLIPLLSKPIPQLKSIHAAIRRLIIYENGIIVASRIRPVYGVS